MTNPTVLITQNNDKGAQNSPSEPIIDRSTVILDADSSTKDSSGIPSRKLAGFLVSYSHLDTGEYWPLYLGKNDIGKSTECDVVLRERQVSDLHATINIRRIKNKNNDNSPLAYIVSDNNSTNGTQVNDEDLVDKSNLLKLKHNDIIDIGEYRLMLVALDNIILGLSVNPNFVSLDNNDHDDGFGDYDQRSPNSTRVYQ